MTVKELKKALIDADDHATVYILNGVVSDVQELRIDEDGDVIIEAE